MAPQCVLLNVKIVLVHSPRGSPSSSQVRCNSIQTYTPDISFSSLVEREKTWVPHADIHSSCGSKSWGLTGQFGWSRHYVLPWPGQSWPEHRCCVLGLACCGLLPYVSRDDASREFGNNKRSVCSQATFSWCILAWGIPSWVTSAVEFQ